MKKIQSLIKTQRTARHFLNEPAGKPERVIFVLHGYAQLAEDFIGEFSFLDDGSTLLVAPEGLSRFYSKGNVGASWMTKELRFQEIDDYVSYLDSVESDIRSKFGLDGSESSVLGFSQGVHTAVRWFTASRFEHHRLVLCSSDFPADADFKKLISRLGIGSIRYIQGRSDDITGMRTFERSCALLESHSVPFTKLFFEGKHEIDPGSILGALRE